MSQIKHIATSTALSTQLCSACDMVRAFPAEYQDDARRRYKACKVCRARNPKLRRPLK